MLEPDATEKLIVSLGVVGPASVHELLLPASEIDLQLIDHGLRDILLDIEQLGPSPVVRFTPQHVSGVYVDKAGSDPDTGFVTRDVTLEHVPHPECCRDFLDRQVLSLERERRGM